MSSSSDSLVPTAEEAVAPRVRTVHHPDLSPGTWTRLGPTTVRGDEATEGFLGDLAEQARDAARAQGYAVGWAAGLRDGRAAAAATAAEVAELRAVEHKEAEARRDAELLEAVAALHRAAAALQDAAADICDRIAGQATELAFAATEELVGRELAAAVDPGADAVRRVLAALPASGAVTVRLPAALVTDPAVRAAAADLDDSPGLSVTIAGSADLGPGDAVVETDTQVVDLRVGPALARLREVLS